MVWYEKHTGISFQIFFHSNIIQPMSVSWVSRERCKEVQENCILHILLIISIFIIFTFEKNHKKPSEGLELVILLHT